MKRNKLAKMLSLMLVMGLGLSACGNQNANVQEGSQSAQSSSEKDESTASSDQGVEEKPYWEMLDEVSDTSELPDWTGDTLEINIWYAGGTAAPTGYFDVTEDNVYWNEIERVTGIKVNWEECYDNGGNNIDAKLPMVVASGDMPTIIMGYDISNQMQELYENGYLLDLTKYYENGYLNQLTEKWYPMDVMDAQVYNQMRTADGEYHLIPNGVLGGQFGLVEAAGYELEEYDADYYNTYASTPRIRYGWGAANAVWVRDDIVTALYPDALTMDEIEQMYVDGVDFTNEQAYDLGLKNMDDFVAFLQDVQELVATGDYVDKNGKQIAVTYGPHTETDNWTYGTCLPTLVDGIFGFDYFSYLDRNATEASQYLKRTIDSEEYVGFLRTMNQLVREDIVSQDSLLDNAAMFDEKIKNHSYAVTYFNNMSNDNGVGDGYRYRQVWVECELGEEVQAVKASKLTQYVGICEEDLSEEEVDQIVHMINYVNSTVGLNCYTWGPASAGFFTEDAEGDRSFTNEELQNYLINGQTENSDYIKKVGIYAGSAAVDGFAFVATEGVKLCSPSYLAKSSQERMASNAHLYFVPTANEAEAIADQFVAASGIDVYGSGQVIEELQTFWKARTGFEDQMKKMLVAEDEAAFEEQLQKLREYADSNSFTAEAMQKFSEYWAELNEVNLKAAGKLK